MSPSSMFESPKGRRIREINNQLINQFHPAVKNVAFTSQNLARVYESESRAFHAYTSALLTLAHSGDNAADGRARKHAEHLRRTVQILQKIHSEQMRWVEYFAKLSVITNQNYESEKDRLKNLFNSYSKKEKNLLKTLTKTKHTRFDMEDFYEEELTAMADQQTQRYRFFAERHDELLRRSRECANATLRLVDRDFFDVITVDSPTEEESARKAVSQSDSEFDSRDARTFSERRRSFELASTEKLLEEWRKQASLDQKHLDDLYEHAEAEQRQLDQQQQKISKQELKQSQSSLHHKDSKHSQSSQNSNSGGSPHPEDPAGGSPLTTVTRGAVANSAIESRKAVETDGRVSRSLRTRTNTDTMTLEAAGVEAIADRKLGKNRHKMSAIQHVSRVRGVGGASRGRSRSAPHRRPRSCRFVDAEDNGEHGLDDDDDDQASSSETSISRLIRRRRLNQLSDGNERDDEEEEDDENGEDDILDDADHDAKAHSVIHADDGERENEEVYEDTSVYRKERSHEYMRSLSHNELGHRHSDEEEEQKTGAEVAELIRQKRSLPAIISAKRDMTERPQRHNTYEEKQRLLEASERLNTHKTPVPGGQATPLLALLQRQKESETSYLPSPDYPDNPHMLEHARKGSPKSSSLRTVSQDNSNENSLTNSSSFEQFLLQQKQKQAERRRMDSDQRKGEGREESQNSTTVQLPPIFSVSNYGKLLECIMPYEARGDNQLTLDIGDRVVLVKSGTRGWVLGRTEDGKNMSNGDRPTTSTLNTANGPVTFVSKLLVNRKRQEGNPLLKYVRNVPYEWSADIRSDYECSKNCGVLYLSLKYHKLHPGYIDTRFSHIKNYEIKVLLTLVNVEEPATLLRDLNLYCYRNGWTPVLCYSVEEAAEYLENFKFSENRSPETTIANNQQYRQQRLQPDAVGRLPTVKEHNQQLFENAVKFFSSIRSVSQTDAKRLLGHFGSIYSVSRASIEDLELCPGLGPIKAQNIFNFFRAPFLLKS